MGWWTRTAAVAVFISFTWLGGINQAFEIEPWAIPVQEEGVHPPLSKYTLRPSSYFSSLRLEGTRVDHASEVGRTLGVYVPYDGDGDGEVDLHADKPVYVQRSANHSASGAHYLFYSTPYAGWYSPLPSTTPFGITQSHAWLSFNTGSSLL